MPAREHIMGAAVRLRGKRTWALGCLAVAMACGGDPVAADDGGSGSDGDSDATVPAATTGGEIADASTSAASSTGGDASSTGGAPDDPAGHTGVGCGADALGPGVYTDLEIEHEGRIRTFDLFVPSTSDGESPVPLVVNMHGWGSSKEKQALFSGLSDEAQVRGYAVAYPQGFEASWNGGMCCGGAVTDDLDDVGFVVALVDHLEDVACVDRDRVYAAGFSNGGYMAYRLACDAPGIFAAVAPVAAVMGIPFEDCDPGEPISVIHFHGTDDWNVAYDGRPWLGVPGVRDVMAHWAARNGCDPDPVVTSQVDDVTCETWPGCEADVEVTLCTVEGAGHCWPGNPDCTYGDSTTTISANERMLDAFDQHAL